MFYVDGRVYLTHEWEVSDGGTIDFYNKVVEMGFVGKDDGMRIVATHGSAGKDNTNDKVDFGNPYVSNLSYACATERDVPRGLDGWPHFP